MDEQSGDICRTPWGVIANAERLLTTAEARLLDLAVTRDFGVSALQLMEQAGMAVALCVIELLDGKKSVLIMAGNGQNGGDGWVASRILHARGISVSVLDAATGCKLPPEAAQNREAARLAGVPIFSGDTLPLTEIPDVIVDTLFGNGFTPKRGMPAEIARLIRFADRWREQGSRVLAVDLPSGVAASTGARSETTMKADLSLALMRPKVGQVTHPGILQQDALTVEVLGITPGQVAAVLPAPGIYSAGAESVASLLSPWQKDRHKGQGGRATLIGGSADLPGAAVLSAKAMAMTGIGYTSICTDPALLPVYLQVLPEALFPHDPAVDFFEEQDAIGYGPGLGSTPHPAFSAILHAARQLVIDADGLRHLAQLPDWMERLRERQVPAVLTPHVGEFRLLHDYDPDDRVKSAVELAASAQSVVVLKGMSTVVAAPDRNAVILTVGNAGLAKGGSGDVLTGLVTGFLAGGLPPFSAAVAAVYVHGAAADLAAGRIGERSLLPQDVLAELPPVFARLTSL